MRRVHHESIGEAVEGHSEVSADTVLPHFCDVLAITILQPHLRQPTHVSDNPRERGVHLRSGKRIEPGGQHHDVEVDLPVANDHARLVECLERFLVQIDDIHVILIDDLIVVLLKRAALGAKVIRLLFGCHELPLSVVLDALADLAGPEVIYDLVRLFVQHDIIIVQHEKVKTAAFPEIFEPRFSLFGRNVEDT